MVNFFKQIYKKNKTHLQCVSIKKFTSIYQIFIFQSKNVHFSAEIWLKWIFVHFVLSQDAYFTVDF